MVEHRTVSQLQLSDYLSIFSRRWKAVIGILCLTALAAYVATSLQEPSYRARSEVLLRTASTTQLFPSAPDTANRLIRQSQAEITYLNTGEFRNAAFEAADATPGTIDVSIELLTTETSRDTGVIRFEVEGPSPEDAAAAANAFATTYIAQRNAIDIRDIDRRLSDEAVNLAGLRLELTSLRAPLDAVEREITETVDPIELATLTTRQNQLLIQLGADVAKLESELTQVESLVDELSEASEVIRNPDMTAIIAVAAQPPSSPSSRGLSTNLPIALAVGLLLGVGVALLLDSLDNRVHNDDELRSLIGLPVLGRINNLTPWWKWRPSAEAVADGPEFESFRSLRSSLALRAPSTGLGLVQVTSPTEGNGKTTVTRHLAHAFAQRGDSVLVIDADLRRPTLHDRFSIQGSTGLAEVLTGEIDFASATVFDSTTRVFVLPAGTKPTNPSELLGGDALQQLCKEAREEFDLVLVDSPPLLPVPDARIIGTNVDAVVLVSDPDKNSRRDLRESLTLLEEPGVLILGVVLNRVRSRAQVYRSSYT